MCNMSFRTSRRLFLFGKVKAVAMTNTANRRIYKKNRTFSQIDVNACKNECFVTYFIVLSVQLQQEKKTKE